MALFTQPAATLFALYNGDGSPRKPGTGLDAWGTEVEAAIGRMALPSDYGAAGNGTTIDTVALQAFFNNPLKFGILPAKTFLISGTVTIPTGFCLLSLGATIKATSGGFTMLSCVDADEVVITGRLNIVGTTSLSATSPSPGAAVGFQAGGNNACHFEGIYCKGIAGTGINVSGGSLETPRGDKNVWINPRAKLCYIGFVIAPNTSTPLVNEYDTIYDVQATYCNIGVYLGAGNNSLVGGKIVDNYDGLWLVPGNNVSHAPISGVQINHNSNYNVNADSQTAGCIFSGCTFFGDSPTAGALRFVNSRGIMIVGGLLESSVYCDGSASNIGIYCNYNNNNFAIAFLGTNPERIFKALNLDTNHRASWNDEGWDYVNAIRSGTTQALSGAAVVVFNTVNRNVKSSYSNSTGVFTAKTAGQFRVTTQVKFQGTGVSGFISVRKNGADYAYSPLVLITTNFWGAAINVDVPMAVGDTLDVYVVSIAGTSPAVAINPGTTLSIKGL